jgi:hypothetical protein
MKCFLFQDWSVLPWQGMIFKAFSQGEQPQYIVWVKKRGIV